MYCECDKIQHGCFESFISFSFIFSHMCELLRKDSVGIATPIHMRIKQTYTKICNSPKRSVN